jgi:hypothetical protein
MAFPFLVAAAIIAAVVVTAVALYNALSEAKKDADENFSTAPVGTTRTTCPADKVLKGEVIEVEWKSGIKVSISGPSPPPVPKPAQATVVVPHWKVGEKVEDGAGSLRPGVYLLKGKGSDAVTVTVRITENKNVSGDGTLTGNLAGLQIEGTCPTAVGEHTVSATIKNLPDAIQWYRGNVPWNLAAPDYGSTITLTNATRLETFVVLDTPAALYDPPGVWVEALRFLCEKTGVIGLKTDAQVADRLATYFHGSHGLRYDTTRGAPKYGAGGSGGTFKLASYMNAASTVVNCYDQASAMQSFCGAVGTKATWYYLAPFGYINTTNLIGVGSCNNPFYGSNGSTAVVSADDPLRTAFGNHAFCGLASKVLDACAGPHTGAESKAQYCMASIDSTPSLYVKYGGAVRPGTAGDITEPGGITKVV